MSKSILRALLVIMFLIPLGINAQTDNTIAYKSVKYKANVDAPLTSSEMSNIKEVYKEFAKDLVLNNPSRLKSIKHLLRNRIRIIRVDIKGKQKNYELLSDVPLFNIYNKNLKRDTFFNKDNFNPLKYNFNFFPSVSKMYRVDDTNYFIQIKSQFQ